MHKQPSLAGLLREGKILEGAFWAERVKVVSAKRIGSNIEIQAVGVKTNTFYPGARDDTVNRLLDFYEKNRRRSREG